MGILDDIIEGLLKIFCGGSGAEPPSQQPQQIQPTSPQEFPSLQHQQTVSHDLPPPQVSYQQGPQYALGQQQDIPYSPPHKPYYQGQDHNQINQHNEQYMSLRAQANQEGDAMAKCFEESHEAYSRGDGAGAKQLSNQGHEHQHKMESLNKQASDWIFVENNKDSDPGEINLHGLYVKEAIAHTDNAVEQAKQRGNSYIRLIVGKGLHSQGGHAKIKPAIEELMQKHELVAELDPHNAGVLIVHLDGKGRGMNPDEVTRRLKRKDQDCVVM